MPDASRVGAGHVQHQFGLEHRQRGMVAVLQPVNVLGIADAIGQVNIEARGRLFAGIVVELVDGKSEYRKIARENGGCAVAVVDVAIHHHGAADGAVPLYAADGDRDVVKRAEAFAVAGESVMESAAYVEPHARLQRQLRGQDCAAGRQAERLRHLPGVGNLQPQDVLVRKHATLEFHDPFRVVRQKEVLDRRGLGRNEILGCGEARPDKPVVQPLVLFRWEYVVAKMEVVLFVIDQPERKHALYPGLQRHQSPRNFPYGRRSFTLSHTALTPAVSGMASSRPEAPHRKPHSIRENVTTSGFKWTREPTILGYSTFSANRCNTAVIATAST